MEIELYTKEDILNMLTDVGFKQENIEFREEGDQSGIFVARK